MFRCCPATTADQACTPFRQLHRGPREVLRRREIDETALKKLRVAGIRERRDCPFVREVSQEADHCLGTVYAVYPDDVRIGLAKPREGLGNRCPIAQAALLIAGQRTDRRTMMQGLFYLEGDQQLLEIEKRFQKDELHTTIEQGPDLLAEQRRPIEPAFIRLFGRHRQRTTLPAT